MRILLIGYLYGVSSERKLVEELRMHLAWRWFTGLGFDQEVPNHSTFSKNRHGRFQESKVFEHLFEEVVAQCLSVGQAQRQRKKVEAPFAELKSHGHIGLHRLPLRRLKFVREQFFLAATAQNIKRLVRFLSRPTMSPLPATA